MKEIKDEKLWNEYMVDTPLGCKPSDTLEATMKCPGCCVKSKEAEKSGFPKYFGRVSKYSEERVVVVSHPDQKRIVWDGSTKEFFNMWRCD